MKETIVRISIPNFRKTFYIHVDTSKNGYDSILTQHPDDPLDKPAPKRSGIPKKHKIVAFISLALPKHNKNIQILNKNVIRLTGQLISLLWEEMW